MADVGAGASRDPYLDDATRAEFLSFDTRQIADFFDLFVAEKPQNTEVPPRVRWHLGHVGWKESETWPPAGTTENAYEVITGRDEPRHGLLKAPGATSATSKITWVHDPEDPVPSDTSIENIWLYLANYPDIRDRVERSDVLTFATPPLEDPVDVTGQPRLEAVFASTGPTMHVFAVLEDVGPDGTTRPISHGRTHVQHGEFGETLTILLDDVSYRFLGGHRIQLQIASSDSQWYVVHPGTDENPWLAETTVPNTQSLSVGGDNPPLLILPILTQD